MAEPLDGREPFFRGRFLEVGEIEAVCFFEARDPDDPLNCHLHRPTIPSAAPSRSFNLCAKAPRTPKFGGNAQFDASDVNDACTNMRSAVGHRTAKSTDWRARAGVDVAGAQTMKRVPRISWIALLAVLVACPSQGQKAMTDERPTVAFRAEHREVQEHLRHVHEWVGALPAQEPEEQRKTAQKVASFFETHIKPHAEWEEKFLYPVVDRLAGGGANAFTSTMRYEHRVVGRWITELRAESDKTTIEAAKFARRTDNLLGLLWAHFEEEEEVLLPFIDEGMSKAQFERELGEGARTH